MANFNSKNVLLVGLKGEKGDTGDPAQLVNTTGQATDKAMTQKASTDNFALKEDLVNISGGTRNLLTFTTSNGVKYGVTYNISNESITLNGTAVSGSHTLVTSNHITLSAGSYRISIGGWNTVSASSGRIYIYKNNALYKSISPTDPESNYTNLVLTESADVYIAIVSLSNGVFDNAVLTFQIESGTEKTEYISPITAKDYIARENAYIAGNKSNPSILHTTITDISSYTQNNGIIDSDNTWWKVQSQLYKHIVIPVPNNCIEFDVSVTAGTETCRLGAVKSYPTPVNGETLDFSSYWVRNYRADPGKTFSGKLPKDAKYLIINTLYNGVSTISSITVDIYTAGSVGELNYNLTQFNGKITFGTQNIRDFNTSTGGDEGGCPDNLVSTNLPLWKTQFSKYLNCDFLAIQEWFPYFDKSHTIDSYNTLLKQFFPYKYELNSNIIILSKHKCTFSDLRSFVNTSGLSMPMLSTTINGKSVAVVCWIQSVADSAARRALSAQNAIDFLTPLYDSIIIGGDTNVANISEMSVWTNAGFTIGNGGYWGNIPTCETYVVDNVMTKGFIFEDFEVGETVTSDHKAVKATLRLI